MTKSQERSIKLIKIAASEKEYTVEINKDCGKNKYISIYEKGWPKYFSRAGHFFIGPKGGVIAYNSNHATVSLTKWITSPFMMIQLANK